MQVLATLVTAGPICAARIACNWGSVAYVTDAGSNEVSAIDTATNTVVTTLPTGQEPFDLVASRDGHRLYVTCYDTVSVIGV